jgi:thiol-disulfide isomerase/thioredoxin
MMQRTVWLWAVVVAWLWFPAEAQGQYSGRQFPDFAATDAVTRERFALSDLRGKVVVVDFWATWCGPCVREVPNLKRAYSKYKSQGLEIVSISLDTDKRRFQSFVRDKRMTWRHVMEGGGWKTRLAQRYRVNSIPRMYVIGPNGLCIAENVGGRSLDSAIKRGLAMIGEEEPSPAKRKSKQPPKPRREPKERSHPRPRAEPAELKAARAAIAGMDAPIPTWPTFATRSSCSGWSTGRRRRSCRRPSRQPGRARRARGAG